jgi:hypothetical protein
MKQCKEINCIIVPNFNFQDKKKGLYCLQHKKENMVNVMSKKCLENNCNRQPMFNFLNEKIGIYCSKHKKEKMINIGSKKCLENNCNKIPCFNLPGKNLRIYCKDHKKVNMINVSSKKCIEGNCNKKPSFNISTKKSGLYCKDHKKEEMINVVDKRCKECLSINPVFNFINKKGGIYCFKHKKDNMINVKTKKCLEKDCIKHAAYNLKDFKNGLFCKEHKKENMINVKDKRCKECNDIFITGTKFKGYCCRCFINKFPNQQISKNYKIKENHMIDFIKEQFKNEIMIFDKTVGGCSLRHPDCYIDKFTHILIIECDENQHHTKDYSNCDTKRTMELFQDFNYRPIVFIRFNPDSYINNSIKILSSFKNHKGLDIPVIRCKKEWNNRLIILKNNINKWLNEIPNKELTYEYLFYDN